MLLPTSLAGSCPQPDLLIDNAEIKDLRAMVEGASKVRAEIQVEMA